MNSLFYLIIILILISFICGLGNFLSIIMILENFNIFVLLFYFLSHSYTESYSVFLLLLVLMTLEVSIGLSLACCLWNINSLDDMFLL
nr:NADH dehydrogenase subunit 4L [Neoheterobothrium hirame]